jgi:hypothetical protein
VTLHHQRVTRSSSFGVTSVIIVIEAPMVEISLVRVALAFASLDASEQRHREKYPWSFR